MAKREATAGVRGWPAHSWAWMGDGSRGGRVVDYWRCSRCSRLASTAWKEITRAPAPGRCRGSEEGGATLETCALAAMAWGAVVALASAPELAGMATGALAVLVGVGALVLSSPEEPGA